MPEFLIELAQKAAIWALPVLLAVTLHEVAHGWVARALGDPTAALAGRLSLNPLKHVDPIGTVLVPGVLLALGGFLFGWAKPVPVAAHRLPNPRRDMAIVAIAGPASNLLMALGWAIGLKLCLMLGVQEGVALGLRYMCVAGVVINLVLMVLNLLPLPPLDGGRVLAGVVPDSAARLLDRIEPFGLFILIGLLATGVLGQVLYWPLHVAEGLLFQLLNIQGSALY